MNLAPTQDPTTPEETDGNSLVPAAADAGGGQPETQNAAPGLDLTVSVGQPNGTKVELAKGGEPELTATTAFEPIAGQDEAAAQEVKELKNELSSLRTTNDSLNESNAALLQTQGVLQSQKEEELRRNISLLTQQLAEKEVHCTNMMKEVERRNGAIKSCGEEIVKLREEAVVMKSENSRLAGELDGIRSNEKREMERITQLLREEVSAVRPAQVVAHAEAEGGYPGGL